MGYTKWKPLFILTKVLKKYETGYERNCTALNWESISNAKYLFYISILLN